MRSEPVDERSERDLGERGDPPVDVVEDVVGSGRIGCDDAPEASALGREGAGVGILEGDRLVGAQSEMSECEPVEIWFWLGRLDVIAAGEGLEPRQQAETTEVFLAVCVIGIGRERDRPALSGSGVHQGDHTRQDGLGERAPATMVGELFFQFHAIGIGPEGAPRIEGVVGVADAADEQIALERQPVRGVDIGKGVDQRRFRVEDETIEVEDEGARHGGNEEGIRTTAGRNGDAARIFWRQSRGAVAA